MIQKSEVAVPWRVLALDSGVKRLANRSQGLNHDGSRLIQTLPESIYRIRLRLAENRSIVACVIYRGHQQTRAPAAASIRVGSRSIVSDTMYVGDGFAVFQWRHIGLGAASFELTHRANPGTPLPLKVVAIGGSRPRASFRDLHDLSLRLRWLAESRFDTRHGLPESKRLPLSVDGCTRDGVILTQGDSLSIPLPPLPRDFFLTFSLVNLAGAKGTSVTLYYTGEGDTLPIRVADYALPQKTQWVSYRVDTRVFPPNSKTIRFGVSGTAALVGIAEPMLLPKEAGSDKLNLLVIDLDTVRADRLGCYGYKSRQTSARLDSMIAAKGFALFERAYAPSPWTLSSTAKFLASRYTHEEMRNSTSAVSDGTALLAEIMRENGYYCAAFTGGAVLRTPGFERGFHEYHWSRSYGKVEDSFPQAFSWLRDRVEPFFLFLHTYEAHRPYTRATFCDDSSPALSEAQFNRLARATAVSRSESLYIQALYDGGVKAACDATADLFVLMDTLDLWQQTVVVVLSDHGEELWEHFGTFARHGHSLYDELLSVPFLIYSPKSDGYRRIPERVSLVDLVPTVAELLSLEWAGVADGLSIVPYLHGRDLPRRPIVATMSNGAPWAGACLFTSSHKYIEMFSTNRPNRSGTFADLTYEPGRELYALNSDPTESKNLISLDPSVARFYSDTLRSSLANLLPPLTGNTNEDDHHLHPALEEQLRVLGYVD
jgi:arylsulfatase A-like enzyme